MGNINIQFSYEHTPTIEKFNACNKKIIGLMGPIGSGKSSGCLWKILRHSFEQVPCRDGIRRTKWAVIRNSFRELQDSTIRTVIEWLPPIAFGKFRGIPHYDYLITGFEGCEIELVFRPLDNPSQIGNLLSVEYTGAWANEAREIPRSLLMDLEGRLNRYPPLKECPTGATWSGLMMDTNAPDNDSWWYNLFEVEKPDNAAIFKQPSGLSSFAENILSEEEYNKWVNGDYRGSAPGLKPTYYTDLLPGKPKDWIDVYIHGKYGFVKEGQPVYENSWNDLLHVSEKPLSAIEGRELIIGFDFGYLESAAVIVQISPRGYLNVLDEVTSDKTGILNFSQNKLKPLLAMKYPGFKVVGVGDPTGANTSQSDEVTCFQILKNEGFDVEPARSNDLAARVGAVENFLSRMTDGKPTFRLDPSCVMLRKGFNGKYYLKKSLKSEGVFAYEPLKNTWCVDSTTEILTTEGFKKHTDLRIGEDIYGYDLSSKALIMDRINNITKSEGDFMIDIYENQSLSMAVTPEHKCIARRRTTSRGKENLHPFEFVEARDLHTGHHLLRIPENISLRRPKDKEVSNDFIKLCAWVMTEGSYRKDGAVEISQSLSINPIYCEHIKNILNQFPNTSYKFYTQSNKSIQIGRIQHEMALLIKYLMPFKYPSPQFIQQMTTAQKRLFLYEAFKGDGQRNHQIIMPEVDIIERYRDFWLTNDTPRLCCGTKEEADTIQHIAFTAGIQSSMKKVNQTKNMWRINFTRQRKTTQVAFLSKYRIKTDFVWCPETNTHAWVARRNGKIFITGNSHPQDALQYACMKILGGSIRKSIERKYRRTYTPASSVGY